MTSLHGELDRGSMGRVFTIVAGTVAVAAGLTMSTPAAMAKSTPVSAVIKHGIYKAIVVCPRWNGPKGGPAPLLAAPRAAKSANPKPGRLVPQPVYSPLVTCTVTFFKDAPGTLPSQDKTAKCSPASGVVFTRHPAQLARVCCADLRHVMGRASSCLVLDTGFGGMARQVSQHEPGLPRHHRA